jgi:hypothetical protein
MRSKGTTVPTWMSTPGSNRTLDPRMLVVALPGYHFRGCLAQEEYMDSDLVGAPPIAI